MKEVRPLAVSRGLRFGLFTVVLGLLCLICVPAFAQEGIYPHLAPSAPKAKKTPSTLSVRKRKQIVPNRIAISSLKGIRFIPSTKDFDKGGAGIAGITFDRLPALNTAAFKGSLAPLLGKPLTFKEINHIISLIESAYNKKNLPFVDAVVPPQNVTNGVLQVVIVEFRVSKINVSGNRYFSNNFILSLAGITAGKELSAPSLLSGLEWLNENPFLHADALLSPGSATGDMALDMLVKDENPLRVYAGMDNQGIPSLGINEWNLGFNYGNLFDSGQMLSSQFTKGFNARYQVFSLNYDAPFPWKGKAGVNAYYATAVPRLEHGLDETGKNEALSFYYKQELPLYIHDGVTVSQSLGIGYDLKTTNNNLAFGGVQVFNSTAQVDQFPLYYSFKENDAGGSTLLDDRLIYSPGHIDPDNSTDSFSEIFYGAKSRYFFDNLSLVRTQELPLKTSFYSYLDFQVANANLLYTEQLAAGGLETSPGYSPDTATGSRGIILREEFNLPGFDIGRLFALKYQAPANIGLFWTYADLSQVSNASLYTGLPDTAVLESAGPELSIDVAGYLSVRFELGSRLRRLPYGSYGNGLSEDIEITGVL